MSNIKKYEAELDYLGDDRNDAVRIVNEAQRKQNSINKSVQRGATNKKNKKRKQQKKGFIAGALAAVILMTGIKVGVEVNSRIKDAAERNEATAFAVEMMQDNFVEAGLGTVDENGHFIIGDNSTEDYDSAFDYTANDGLLYTAYELIVDDNDQIRTNDEFKDFLGSVSYDGVHNFDDNMFTVMGYIDKDTGKTSVSEFKKAGQDALLEAYRNGTLENVLGSNNGRSK